MRHGQPLSAKRGLAPPRRSARADRDWKNEEVMHFRGIMDLRESTAYGRKSRRRFPYRLCQCRVCRYRHVCYRKAHEGFYDGRSRTDSERTAA